jgi:hypothetical protein
MKVLTIALILLLTNLTFGQPSSGTNPGASQTWPSFWRQFSVAINKRDTVALKRMMPDDFFDGGGGMTPGEWLKYINENSRNGSWRDLRRSVARGTMTKRSSKGVPTRVTWDNGYYFEFRADKKWYFAGVVGD